LQGWELFKRQKYFEAHEVWEDEWKLRTGEEKRLIQILILISAGAHHLFHRSNRPGCLQLWRKARDRSRAMADQGSNTPAIFARKLYSLSQKLVKKTEVGENPSPELRIFTNDPIMFSWLKKL